MFFHLLDLSIVNANILHNLVCDKPMSQLDFRVAVVSSLLAHHTPHITQRYYAPNRELPSRLMERPFPERIPSNTPSGGRPQCVVCSSRGIRSQTRFRCSVCKTPLHIENCLEIYHTILHYEHSDR